MKSFPSEQNAMGSIKYNEDVLKTMVGMAIKELKGVAEIEGKGTAGLLGRKKFSSVNKISVEGNKLVLDLSLVLTYGLDLRAKALETQQKISAMIENMTDLTIGAINVTVASLDFKE